LYAGLLACCRVHGPQSHALPTRRDVRIERHDSTVYRLHNAQRAYRTLPAQAGACGPSIRMFRAGAMAHAGGENGLCRVAQEILIASGLEIAVETHRDTDDLRRRRWPDTSAFTMQPGHELVPDGARAADARDFTHAGACAVAHPDAHGVILRPADAPIVAHVAAGAGLDRRPEWRGQGAVQPEGARPGLPVGQNIAHDPGGAGRKEP